MPTSVINLETFKINVQNKKKHYEHLRWYVLPGLDTIHCIGVLNHT